MERNWIISMPNERRWKIYISKKYYERDVHMMVSETRDLFIIRFYNSVK